MTQVQFAADSEFPLHTGAVTHVLTKAQPMQTRCNAAHSHATEVHIECDVTALRIVARAKVEMGGSEVLHAKIPVIVRCQSCAGVTCS